MYAVEPKFYNLYLFIFFIPLPNQVKGTSSGLENTAQHSIYVALL